MVVVVVVVVDVVVVEAVVGVFFSVVLVRFSTFPAPTARGSCEVWGTM